MNINKQDATDQVIDFVAATVQENFQKLSDVLPQIQDEIARRKLSQALGMCLVLADRAADTKIACAMKALTALVNASEQPVAQS